MIRWYILIVIITITGNALAFEPPPLPPETSENSELTEQPPSIEELLQRAELEAQVTIIRRADEMIKEYRINGILTMIKVIPDFGPAYYLIDSNGDGVLESSNFMLDPNSRVPQWVLFRW